ncbi:MAG: hypothetical protein ACYC35_28200 [Pirellulales bacterium]
MPPVRTVFTSDETDVIKAMQRMQAEMAKLIEENKRLRNESKQQGGEGIKLIGDQISSLKSMALGYLSVEAAIHAVMAAEEKRAQRQQNAANAQLGAADAQRVFLKNVGAVSLGEKSSVLTGVAKIAEETGVTTRDLYAAGAVAMSARGNLGNKTALDAMRMAAKYAPENAGEMAAVAGGLLSTSRLTGTPDAEKNLGFMIGLQSRVRISDMKGVSENLIPAARSVARYGGSAAEAASLPAALTMALEDTSGAVSGTASIQMATQLAEALPKLGSTGERIGYMQSHPGEAAKFLKGASFDVKAKGSIAELLTNPQSAIAQIYAENVKAIPGPDQAAGLARDMLSGLDAEKLQQTAALSRNLQQIGEGIMLGGEEGRQGVTREGVDRILAATGQYEGFAGKYLPMHMFGRNDPDAEALEHLRYRETQIKQRVLDTGIGASLSGKGYGEKYRDYTEQERKDLASIGQAILVVLESQRKATENNRPSPRPRVDMDLEK